MPKIRSRPAAAPPAARTPKQPPLGQGDIDQDFEDLVDGIFADIDRKLESIARHLANV